MPWASPTTRRRPRHLRRAHRDHDRRRLRHLGRDGQGARPVPRLRRTASTCCASSATTAAPPTAPGLRLRGAAITPVRSTREAAPPGLVAPRAPPGTARSSSARSTATATRRPPVIAPTGTIGLVMDCDTTGIEPDFALVKFKKLAGGGYFKIINQSVPRRCARSATREPDRRDRGLCRRPRHAGQAPGHQPRDAQGQGLRPTKRSRRSRRCRSAFDIKFVFNKWTLGEEFLQASSDPDAQLTTTWASTCSRASASPSADIEAANDTSAAR
jgi:ribonucleoside-diphosphate reductase alpha chain